MLKLKKASQIVMLVGAILGIFCVVGFVIGAVVFFLCGSNAQLIRDMLADGTIKTDLPGTPEQQAQAIADVFIVLGVLFLVFAVPGLVASILGFKNKDGKSKSGLIVTIVFSALGLNTVLLVGAILGTVCAARETKNPPVVNE